MHPRKENRLSKQKVRDSERMSGRLGGRCWENFLTRHLRSPVAYTKYGDRVGLKGEVPR